MKRMHSLGVFSAVVLCLALAAITSASAGVRRSPSASTTIVISQAYGGGGGSTGTYLYDYVELKNISNSPQSLNGMALYYGSATGFFGSSASNTYALPNVTLQPGQFYLVQLASAGTAGSELPVTPDVVTTNLTMSATNGKVALVNGLPANSCGNTANPCVLPHEQIVDLVAWGTSNNAEGGVTVNNGASLSSTTGAVRKENGCQDTDHNNNDFDVVSNPVPRNSETIATCGGGEPVNDAPADMNGDGRTDLTVIRFAQNGQATWYTFLNGIGPTPAVNWGLENDEFVPADYDGDQKDDIAIFRHGNPSAFYILQSASNTIRIDTFGAFGDDPSVVGDYNGDGTDDVAVYRQGEGEGGQSAWYYRTSPSSYFVKAEWGRNGDRVAPGDYDGDGKHDFVVRRDENGVGRFFKLLSGGSSSFEDFGPANSLIVPGDYDGDGMTDVAIVEASGGSFVWSYRPSGSPGTTVSEPWGWSQGDILAPGDYNGDGASDFAIFRPGTPGAFYVMISGTREIGIQQWGMEGDIPVTAFMAH